MLRHTMVCGLQSWPSTVENCFAIKVFVKENVLRLGLCVNGSIKFGMGQNIQRVGPPSIASAATAMQSTQTSVCGTVRMEIQIVQSETCPLRNNSTAHVGGLVVARTTMCDVI